VSHKPLSLLLERHSKIDSCYQPEMLFGVSSTLGNDLQWSPDGDGRGCPLAISGYGDVSTGR
jgi:hypothetical protein